MKTYTKKQTKGRFQSQLTLADWGHISTDQNTILFHDRVESIGY